MDVGANVGVYEMQFAHWTGPTGRVIAFEPNPAARAVLQKHMRFNGLEERVEIVPMAVGAKEGTAEFFAAAADGMSRLGAPNEMIQQEISKFQVPVVTLDQFCASRSLSPDWLKMDIEGFEVAALQGARELIRRRGRQLNLIVEFHPASWHLAGMDRSQFAALLDELKLRPRPLTGQADVMGDYGLVHLEYTGA